ncbi:hypothetical protein SAMN05421788_107234 [Filimonas lacunae]|uniref:Uncharacterized protein n=1 Tax=Filimonas lacunae TaxID=477680 RepID=A0A173MGM0_9BACT|nr:hypothetical protein [Filimonas lacunae]BAV06571.1 hypothetical protein FLA_2590 [Filimonas lacunae]SIT27432.1 hypothetical protein SAMN05421788_107234 [Filimonas lacunae]
MYNTVISVVVSLCLIFLLYSLLATIIQEGISTLFHRRANTLYKGIKSMLSNTQPDKGLVVNLLKYLVIGVSEAFWNLLQRLFTGKKEDTLYNRFFNHPVIKNYGQNVFFKKPSYLTADNFSTILIDTLKGLDPQTPATAITLAQLSELISQSKIIDADTKTILLNHVQQAAGDMNVFKQRLEKWFNDSMDRVSGWYKRNTHFTLLLIGMVLAISLNVDSIQITNLLSDNKAAREQMAQMGAAAAANSHYSGADSALAKEVMDSIKGQLGVVNNLIGLGWSDYGRSSTKFREAQLKNQEGTVYKAYVKEATKADSLFHNIVRQVQMDTSLTKVAQNMDSLTLHKNEITARLQFGLLYQQHCLATRLKLSYITYNTGGKKLLGFLFTALAISLGAPFWFDLLNKIVSIRTSVKTVNSSGSTTTNNQSDTNS